MVGDKKAAKNEAARGVTEMFDKTPLRSYVYVFVSFPVHLFKQPLTPSLACALTRLTSGISHCTGLRLEFSFIAARPPHKPINTATVHMPTLLTCLLHDHGLRAQPESSTIHPFIHSPDRPQRLYFSAPANLSSPHPTSVSRAAHALNTTDKKFTPLLV